MSVYRRTFAYYRPFMGETVFAVALSLVAISINTLKPWPVAFLIDGILTPPGQPKADLARAQLQGWAPQAEPATLILFLCLAVVVLHLIWGALNLVTNTLFVRVGLQALLKLRTELYAYLQSLPLKFHDTRRSTDSTFRVAYDSQAIQTIYNKGFTGVFSSVITLTVTLGVMLTMNWLMTLVSLAILPPVMWAIRHYAVRIRNQSTTIQERESAVLTTAQEGLSSIKMVHAFAREEHEVEQFRQSAMQSLTANLQLNTTTIASSLVVSTLMALGTALTYYFGAQNVLGGGMSLGQLTVFLSYVLMLYGPIESLTYTAWAMQGAAAGAQRCFEVLDREDEVKEAPDAQPLPPVQGRISFENVAFAYDKERPILRGVTLDIASGRTLAIVGGTGAGKSTLLSLVPRFYDPVEGIVRIDGTDIRSVTKKSLRDQIGMVLQDTLLFSTTIRENIAYGRPDATEEEIVEAAKRAQAHDFISSLPEGYRSQVGERGGHLSVGQRQRIGIARAFLKNAPILLLDEPTSALDPSTENAIMTTIEELMKGRTTLIVTHRLATIHHVDLIAVVGDGGLLETGTGPELVSRGGAYAKLYASGHYGATAKGH